MNSTTGKVPVEHIEIGERFRKSFDEDKLQELVESIEKNGLINPITVLDKTKCPGLGANPAQRYLLLAGERRLRACIKIGLEYIPVTIFDHVPTEHDLRRIELHENVMRDNLSWQEEVGLKKAIHDLEVEIHGEKVSKSPNAPGHSLRDTAAMLGVSHVTVARDVRVAEAIQQMPELAQLKTKKEALQKIEKLKRQYALEELSKRQAAKQPSGGLEKKKKELCDAYIVDDFFRGVQRIPDSSIDFVEIDPPYGIDLHSQKMLGRESGSTDEYIEVKGGEYIEFIRATLRACYRVMKDHAWGVCWFGAEPWFETVYQSIVDCGFSAKRVPIIWNKRFGQTQHPYWYLANSYETAFYFRKGDAALVKQGKPNLFDVPPVAAAKKIHPTQRPITLIEQLLEIFAFPGARVLVPFAGSGSSLLAASNRGMIPIGFDMQGAYKKEFDGRVISTVGPSYIDVNIYNTSF